MEVLKVINRAQSRIPRITSSSQGIHQGGEDFCHVGAATKLKSQQWSPRSDLNKPF